MLNEELELEFKRAINEISKSDKSILVTFDGNSKSLKNYMLDKFIDLIEPSRYKLCKYERQDFNIKQFWDNWPGNTKITIFDGSFKSELDDIDATEKSEIDFFVKQLKRYNRDILSFKFVDDKKFDSVYNTEKDMFTFKGNEDNKNEMFEKVIHRTIGAINSLLKDEDKEYEPIDKLAEPVDLTSIENKIKYDEYTFKKEQKELQKKIRKLHEKLIDEGKSALIVFQGIDGAGKSSTIRRLISKMCPHWYTVYGIRAPQQYELQHHYLWRFWTKLPKPGEIVLFDRSYYERLTAERVLKLNNNGWVNAVEEIKEFERELEENGTKVIKFFYNISYETQGERFKAREADPLKRWKISANDAKTRERWADYQKAFSEMLGAFDDWNIIDSTNKREARLNCLSIVVKTLKKWLKK